MSRREKINERLKKLSFTENSLVETLKYSKLMRGESNLSFSEMETLKTLVEKLRQDVVSRRETLKQEVQGILQEEFTDSE